MDDVLGDWVKARGGDRVIRKILISNNGLGAAKAIRSMRRWAYQTFRREGVLHFVAMVTPEDIAANAEYIRLADEFVHVPGGSNRNNYANVELIVKVARRCQADAVWPGWGHASENPKLPATLAHHNIGFIGPAASAMDAVGDKICANLLAQSVGVNVIPWSGSGLTVPDITIPPETLRKATLHGVDEALACVKRVGYPCMIKASEGGGGKGIRKVSNDEELKVGYEQVEAEVPGSPIFIQKLSIDSRHLEVQMISDGQGSALALFGRDCSVQRRHQKIIEEGPPIIAPAAMQRELEQGACRLAKKVHYRGAGTVEYLYNMKTGEYSFLEVNPRLQVEHPVTEHITGVNIPGVQLQIAMGIRLSRIADLRVFMGRDANGLDDIDFDTATPIAPKGHCVAVRITAENAEDGFKPTSGAIHSLSFRGVPGITAFFSVGSAKSGVHQFADSQFGHIFALAPTRDAAVALLVNALDDLVIRGEIQTNTKYLQHLLEKPAFLADKHDTAWLDGLIAEKDRAKRPDRSVIVICGAVMVADERHRTMEADVLASLARGVPPEKHAVNLSEHSFELIYEGVKYRLRVTMGGPDLFYIWLNGELVETEVLKMPDGGLKVLLDGLSHIVYLEPQKSGLKCHVDGWPCLFPEDFDPTRMLAPATGKLMRYLVPSGGHVAEGRPYAEIEAMKMIMPLIATSTGVITHTKTSGAALEANDVLCTVLLDDPSSVKKTELFTGRFPPLAPRRLTAGIPEDSYYLKFHLAVAGVRKILAGYDCTGDPLESLLTVMASPQLVADDFSEQKAAVSARTPAPLLDELERIGASLRAVVTTWSGPKRSIAQLDDVALAVKAVAAWVAEQGAEAYPELAQFVSRFEHGLFAHECAVLTSFLAAFLDVEELFANCETFADAVLALSMAHKTDLTQAVALAHSHSKLPRKNILLMRVLDTVDAYGMADVDQCMAQVARFVNLQRAPAYATVSQRAKQIILKKQEESRDSARRWSLHQNSLVKNMPLIKEDATHGATAAAGSATDVSMRHSVSGYLYQGATGSGGNLPASPKIEAARRGSESVAQGGPSPLSLEPVSQFSWASLFDYGAPETQKAALREACATMGVPNAPITVDKGTVRVQMHPSTITYVAPSLGSVSQLLAAHDGDEAAAAAFLAPYPELAENPAPDATAAALGALLHGAGCHESLEQVWFTLVTAGAAHQSFCFKRTASGALVEEPLCRNCMPVAAAQLELSRLSAFSAVCLSMLEPRTARGAAASPKKFFAAGDYRIGVFLGEEKGLQGKVQRDRRLFVRAAVYNKALLLPKSGGKDAAPANLLSGFSRSGPALAQDPSAPHRRRRGIAEDSVLADIMGSMELAVGQHHTAWNFVFVNLVDGGAEDIEGAEEVVHSFVAQCFDDLRRLKVAMIEVKVGPGRVVAFNKTSYRYTVEFQTDMGTPRPYPALTKLQRKRMVAQSVNTTYVYDFIDLFQHTAKADLAGGVDVFTSEMPAFAAVELVLVPGSSPLRLEATSRQSGGNDVGIVVWRCTFVSSAYPDGRDFILVANDITHMSGSFSPAEDDVYVAGTKLAQAEGIPCVYISANSGARIGLDEQLKSAFKTAWINPQDPALGFKYLYLDDADYKFLREKGSNVVVEKRVEDGETRWLLRDVPGGLGVECLQGSGAIATATSEAYLNTFTLTYVTARSVGIGAYCARLSRRIIQHQDAPLILTGSSALNKLLGQNVYTSNNQIGGPKVMGSNGVSHQVVQDDVAGVRSIMSWLSYVPKRRGAALPRLISGDSIRRAPHFTPPKGPYDPREMVSGFYDAGSFTEVMGDWGRSVVAGRACLGGLPLGVIAVETRLSEKIIPADPAFVGAQQTVEQQAGQVWFPDSAFKTAQAIEDFNAEGLPMMIFANWRGFAGGLRDMFGEVLKYGALIVDALRTFRQPVMVYIPFEGELRGGAWVVIDATINPRMMEFYAADVSKGGVLEPEGIVDIKFRSDDLLKAMRRTLPHLASLPPAEAAKVEKELLPLFKQVAVHFASLHDTPGVMKAKNVIKQVVPWAESREFFAKQLRRRLAEERLKTMASAANAEADHAVVLADLAAMVEAAVADDGAITMETPAVTTYMAALRAKAIKTQVGKLNAENPAMVRSALGQQ